MTRTVVSALACGFALLHAGIAAAQEWKLNSGSPAMASSFKNSATLAFLCENGTLSFKYVIEAGGLDPELEGSDEVGVAFSTDVGPVDWNVLPLQLLGSGRSAVAFTGPKSVKWAKAAISAAESIHVALSKREGSLPLLNQTSFAASGSSASIRPGVKECGAPPRR